MFKETYYDARVKKLQGFVLDVGCGKNYDSTQYVSAAQVIAIDVSLGKITQAVSRNRLSSQVETHFVVATCENMPFRANQFDAITISFVFCSVKDIFTSFGEVSRVLSQEGLLLLIEHVRSQNYLLGKIQDLISFVYPYIASNCHLNRDVLRALSGTALQVKEVVIVGQINPWMFLSAHSQKFL